METKMKLTANYPQELILMLTPLNKESYEGDYNTYLKGFYSKENLFPIAEYIQDNLYDILKNTNVQEQNIHWGYEVVFFLKEVLLEGKHFEYAMNSFNVTRYFQWVLEQEPTKIDKYDIYYLVIESMAQYKSRGELEDILLKVWNHIPKHLLDDVFIFPLEPQFLFYEEEELNKYQYVEGKSHEVYYKLPTEPDPIELYLNVIKSLDSKLTDREIIDHVMCCMKLIYDNVTYFIREDSGGNYLLYLQKLRAIVGSKRIPDELYDLFLFFMKSYVENPEDAHEPIKMTKTQTKQFNKTFNVFFDWCISTESYEALSVILDDIFCTKEKNFEVSKNALVKLIQSGPGIVKALNRCRTYFNITEEDLFEHNEYQLIVDLFEIHFLHYRDAPPFEVAYSYSQLKNPQKAKEIYISIIESGKATNAVCNNLGVIYSNIEKNNFEALKWFKKALELDPKDETTIRNVSISEEKVKEEKDRPKKLTELYFKKTNRYHKKLLFAIYKYDNESVTLDELALATKQKTSYVESNLATLIKLGLLSNRNGKYVIDPVIEKLVADFVDAKLERQIIQADQTNLSRPIFFHESEIYLYQSLLELFPQHFVFPNISLKTIVDVTKLREAVSSEQMNYLFMAHVDFAIISTTTYMPVLAIEKDSSYHDNDSALKKDQMKNNILKISGIPLVRIRFNKAMTSDKLKQEIRNVTKDLILSMQRDETKGQRILDEIDIRSFGISEHTEIDLDVLTNIWNNVVGEGISKKSKVTDLLNTNELHVSISSELETIINFSKDKITLKLIEEIPQMKKLIINYY